LNFYVDTSVLVAALGNEQSTHSTQDWLAAQQPGTLWISDWTVTEFSSAQALKLRTGEIEPEHRAESLAQFAHLIQESLVVVSVASANFRTAARFVDQHQTALRAGDGLHLAVCADHGARLATLDKTLRAAARTLGVATLPDNALNP